MHALVRREGVTVFCQTPTAFRSFVRADAECPRAASLRLVILGGEAVHASRLDAWFRRYGDARPRILNIYGPTETTVYATSHRLRADDGDRNTEGPIGRPLADLAVSVADARGVALPAGVAGELLVSGPVLPGGIGSGRRSRANASRSDARRTAGSSAAIARAISCGVARTAGLIISVARTIR